METKISGPDSTMATSWALWHGLVDVDCGSGDQQARPGGAHFRHASGRYRARPLCVCSDQSLELVPAGNPAFEVVGAGAPECNGLYWLAGERDGAPHFIQPQTQMSLVRYRFTHSGRAYWFLSLLDPDGNDNEDLDFYRSLEPTEALTPFDWVWLPRHGQLPVPTVIPLAWPMTSLKSKFTRRIDFDQVKSLQVDDTRISVSYGSGACRTLKFAPLVCDASALAVLLQRQVLASKQRRRLLSLDAVQLLPGTESAATALAHRVLELDAMAVWMERQGPASAAALTSTCRTLHGLRTPWRCQDVSSTHAALALAACHGRRAPITTLSIGCRHGERGLTAAEMRELLVACPALQSLTLAHHSSVAPLLSPLCSGFGAFPALVVLALGSCDGLAPFAVIELASVLRSLQSLTVDVGVVQGCLSDILVLPQHKAPEPRVLRLLLGSIVNVLQGPSPLPGSAPADAERLPWRSLLELLVAHMQPGSDLRGSPEIAAHVAWSLAALLAHCSAEVTSSDIAKVMQVVLSCIEDLSCALGKACLVGQTVADLPLSGEEARLMVHSVLMLCQTALLHRSRGMPKSLGAAMVNSGALGKLRTVAERMLFDQVVLQRVLCVLDLLRYEAPERWPLDESHGVQRLCHHVLSSAALVSDDALCFHAEALLIRLGGSTKVKEMPASSTQEDSEASHLGQTLGECWRARLKPGDLVDAMDTEQSSWYEGRIVEVRKETSGDSTANKVKVHFMGWHPRWDAWIDLATESLRVQHRHRVVRPWRCRLGPKDRLDVKLPEGRTPRDLGCFTWSRDCGRRLLTLPFCMRACTENDLQDASNRTRWRCGEVLEVRREKGELWAHVSVDGHKCAAATASPSSAGIIDSASEIESLDDTSSAIANHDDIMLGELLQAGVVMNFWVDLNSDFVQKPGTHTSRRRPVWGLLLRNPQIPHLCPEGGPARWGLPAQFTGQAGAPAAEMARAA